MDEAIRVLLVDGSVPTRIGVRQILERAGGYRIVGEAGEGAAALELIAQWQPDVVVLDCRLPDLDVVEFVTKVQQQNLAAHILVLSSCEDDDDIRGMLEKGVAGYILRDEPPEKIIEAVRTLARGNAWLSPRIVERMAYWLHSPAPPNPLSEREIEVLRLAARGLTDKEIARELNISHPTVRFHLRQVSEKLGIRGKGKLIAWAFEHGVARVNLAKRMLHEALGEYTVDRLGET